MLWELFKKNHQHHLTGDYMTTKHVRARTAKSARRKAGGKRTTVTKVNYLKGSSRGGMKTYSVTTRAKKRK